MTAWSRMLALTLLLVGCDNAYPEVVIVNRVAEPVSLKEISFNGCLWTGVLAYGEATSPQRCLPGSGQIHFEKFDASKYDVPSKSAPVWFNYETVSKYQADYGDFKTFEIRDGDLEQDFSTPGPYGH